MPAKLILMLAGAGALGTLARYGTGLFVERHATGVFPWPTLVVNIVGCFLFGLLYALAEERLSWQGDARIVVLTGFMGAFTTFSTFAFHSSTLLRDAQWILAVGNILGQNVLGIASLMLGLVLGKAF